MLAARKMEENGVKIEKKDADLVEKSCFCVVVKVAVEVVEGPPLSLHLPFQFRSSIFLPSLLL